MWSIVLIAAMSIAALSLVVWSAVTGLTADYKRTVPQHPPWPPTHPSPHQASLTSYGTSGLIGQMGSAYLPVSGARASGNLYNSPGSSSRSSVYNGAVAGAGSRAAAALYAQQQALLAMQMQQLACAQAQQQYAMYGMVPPQLRARTPDPVHDRFLLASDLVERFLTAEGAQSPRAVTLGRFVAWLVEESAKQDGRDLSEDDRIAIRAQLLPPE